MERAQHGLQQLQSAATTLHDQLQTALAQEAVLLEAQQRLQGALRDLDRAEANRAAQADARWEDAATAAQRLAAAQTHQQQLQRYGCIMASVLCSGDCTGTWKRGWSRFMRNRRACKRRWQCC